MEKNNDTARSVVLRKSNNWDSPADVLRAEHRQKQLQHRERQKRTYQKKQMEYWDEGIKAVRKKKICISKDYTQPQEENPENNLSNASTNASTAKANRKRKTTSQVQKQNKAKRHKK